MRPYIFGKRNLIHIIDIRETVKGLLRAKRFIAQTVAKGQDVLFVGTKRQARDCIRKHAEGVTMPWVAERWLGGTLTNFRTIRSRLARLEELETAEADGTATQFSKKQRSRNTRERKKIDRNLAGIRKMSKLPGVLVIIDTHRETNALREARALGITTICLIDTDSDPDFADIPIPGNDDAIRSIDCILGHLAGAVEEGRRAQTTVAVESPDAPKKRSQRGVTARATDGQAAEGGSGAELSDAASGSSDVAAPAIPES